LWLMGDCDGRGAYLERRDGWDEYDSMALHNSRL
jgi:hypothetical protein